MPITPANMTAAITTGLAGVGFAGVAMPQLAFGIGAGVSIWVAQLVVQTTDTGTLGSGVGAAIFAVPPALLTTNLLASYAGNAHLGPMAPLEAAGLGNGLSVGFAQGAIATLHSSVGTGTGLGRIVAPPAFPSLMQGFAAAGIVGLGAAPKANAISIALAVCMQVLQIPVVITGPSSPSAATGVGIGKIV